ncbi:4-hydroxy-tetrahydrodipicolinate synthase [Solemya velesiana gill symbiont]|uniref:4-hydroxy-tetrahydrodipicolinate synthase n=1 Tax=Solemya velesiana gill symbiont TaxID=1918948 RepID=A0A1T2KV48_9GAMM|nr:4-hydroxy-tetrahydrodipicolinate synthase [Solemya velesiana gill symbiont]OOZ36692.1 4-hydroxy-tetrahydrodipicolinate synthase [Solemya velesiana gill symbiont]
MFRGSMVALVTPMRENGSVDEESLRALVGWHIDQGTDAIVAVGTTGESATLGEEEHCKVIRQVVEFTAGRIPVIAGTGANSTTEAIRLTQCAKNAGADACLLVTPYYNKPTQEGLYLHYKAVAEAVDIPQILYNVPGRTACDMLPETVGRLTKVPNIVGIKEATGDLERVGAIRELCGEDFELYSGDDATGREFVLLGGDGVISVTANVAPRVMHDMITASMDGNSERAAQLDEKLAALHHDLFLEANPIPVKWVLAEMGRIPVGIRLPLTWFAQEYHEKMRQAMAQAELL